MQIPPNAEGNAPARTQKSYGFWFGYQRRQRAFSGEISIEVHL